MLTTLGIVKSYEIKTVRYDKDMRKAQRLNGGGNESVNH